MEKRRLWKVQRRLFSLGEYLGENKDVGPDEEDSCTLLGRDPPFMERKAQFFRRLSGKNAVYDKLSAVYSP